MGTLKPTILLTIAVSDNSFGDKNSEGNSEESGAVVIAIAGISIGIILLVVLFVSIFCIRKKRIANQSKMDNDKDGLEMLQNRENMQNEIEIDGPIQTKQSIIDDDSDH